MRVFLVQDRLAEYSRTGLATVAVHLGVELSDDASHADVVVDIARQSHAGLSVDLESGRALVTFDGEQPRLWRALGLVVEAIRSGQKVMHIEQTPRFNSTGIMVDVSRNAVLTVSAAKWLITAVAVMGLRTAMLYTEDTYELPDYPYFGWKRGAYSNVELRDLDDHAASLGVELVPCIQVLGHLATTLHWPAHQAMADTPAVLQVGDERTYQFIEAMLETVSSSFRSHRIHIGMDETQGMGRGAWLDKNDYRSDESLFTEHLHRVVAMARSHGLEPMIWSDMLFRISGRALPDYRDYDPRVTLSDGFVAELPADLSYVFWDYYSHDQEFYASVLAEHHRLPGPTIMAGGAWAWHTFAVQLERSARNSLAALRAAAEDAQRSGGTSEVLCTIWHNGAESFPITALAGVQVYAEFDYTGAYDRSEVASRFFTCTGARWDDLVAWEAVEHPRTDKETDLARTLLYNDPLGGMADAQIARVSGISEHYHQLSQQLGEQAPAGYFAPAQAVIAALSSVLELKSDFGVRLRRAHEAGDREALASLGAECDELVVRVECLRTTHRAAWDAYHKPHGWEVFDLRYGGLIARLQTTQFRIAALISGERSAIDELTGLPLRVDGETATAPFTERHNGLSFAQIYTAGIL